MCKDQSLNLRVWSVKEDIKISWSIDFCNKDFEKFVLLLKKGLMCYEYIDSREKLNQKLLPKKVIVQWVKEWRNIRSCLQAYSRSMEQV